MVSKKLNNHQKAVEKSDDKDNLDVLSGSPERFGHSWHIFNEILPIHEQQFHRWTKGIATEEWRGKKILDVGCGIGRNSYWALHNGAESALCIDVDERTLAAAKNNLSEYSNAIIKYQSIYDLALHEQFDIAFSIGVIHHLENPQLAIKNMIHALKPEGKILIWLYGFENNEWIVRFFNPFRKLLFSRLPLSVVYALSLPLTVSLWLFLRLGFGKIAYLKMLRQFSFRHLRAIVYDQMIPKIARYYTKNEAYQLLAEHEAELENIQIDWVNQMSWTVTATKKA